MPEAGLSARPVPDVVVSRSGSGVTRRLRERLVFEVVRLNLCGWDGVGVRVLLPCSGVGDWKRGNCSETLLRPA
jgi:hypothetical protein